MDDDRRIGRIDSVDTLPDGGTASKDATFQRLLSTARKLPLKRRLQLLDALKSEAVMQRDDGLVISLESLSEYKRARKLSSAQEPLVQWIRSFGPADVLFDIGANTGSLSLVAAHVHGGRVPVFAFEPAFDNFAALVRNVLANGLGSVITPIHVALFDETGIRPLHRSRLGAGTALHAVGEALDYTRRPFTPDAVEPVLAFRLDDLVRAFALPRPTRIKIDVDGVEDKALAGAIELLSTTRCDVYTELVDVVADDPHTREVTSFLRGLGYELAELVERRPPGVYPRAMDALFVRR